MKLEISAKRSQESIRAYALRIIHKNLLKMNLVPGMALSEQEIANELHISRTPVREAFIRLAHENILVILPQRGTYVEKIALEQVAESMFLRTTMESEVMKLACHSFPTRNIDQLEACLELQRISLKQKDYPRFFEQDGIFHGSIFAACGKHRIWQMIEQASLNYNRLRMMNLANDGENEMPMLFKHHKEMLTAIKQRDIEAGRILIKEHVGKVFSNLDDLKLQYPSYFKGGTEDTLI